MDTLPLEDQVAALQDGRAYIEHSDVGLTVVSGADARSWLHDLITTDVASLQPLRSRASLLLSPTGRIRAMFNVLGRDRDFLLAQTDDQPAPIGELLAPYVLSSDVELGTSSLRVFSWPGARARPPWISEAWRPGIDGDGVDLLVDGAVEELPGARQRLEEAGLIPVSPEAADALRIRRGIPRFPVDLDEESLPAEADLEQTIDLTKGCFLGQESVAKVRNLGHPPRIVLALRSRDGVSPGEPVLSGDDVVGVVTSATTAEHGSALLARVRWAARGSDLRTVAGSALRPA